MGSLTAAPALTSPYADITIRRITGSSPFAGIAVGSETSSGVRNVLAEHINLFDMGVGIHVKTNIGRGGLIQNLTFSNVYMENARKGIKIAGDVGDHPDEKYNPNALPIVKGITMKNIWGVKVLQPGLITGLKNSRFTGICLSNIKLHGDTTKPGTTPWKCSDVSGSALEVTPSPSKPGTTPWKCSDVSGSALEVTPSPCSQLASTDGSGSCSSTF